MKPKTVSEYLESFSGEQKTRLTELHDLIRKTLPDTDEALKWNAPATLDKDGMILIVFTGHKQHMNFVVTPSAKEAFANELQGYVTGKGSIQLAYDKPLPTELLEKIILYRAKEYRENGVNWK